MISWESGRVRYRSRWLLSNRVMNGVRTGDRQRQSPARGRSGDVLHCVRVRGAVFVIAVLMLVFPVVPAIAAGTPPAPFDVGPARCTVEPRTVAELDRILTAATPAPPAQRPSSGPPIDPGSDTGKTVISTIETLFACLNAGDRLRAYALYTDAYLATILQPGDLAGIATPYPNDADEYTRIVAIELHALENGGIIAKVVLDPALIPVYKIFEFILISTDGGWRVDRVIDEINFSLP